MFVNGLLLGFSIAAPVGAIGLLCINRTLAQGWLTGFVCGLGAATADAISGCIAAFGLSYITNFFVAQEFWLRLVGSLFLVYLGIKFIFNGPKLTAIKESKIKLMDNYLSSFALTITNPLTILSFSAIFASFGSPSRPNSVLLVAGVFTGSALWWFLLSAVVACLRHRLSISNLRLINYFSGCVVFGFALIPWLKN